MSQIELLAGSDAKLYVAVCGFIAGAVVLALVPYFVAGSRHPNQGAIFVLCLLFGWTLIGWGLCLAWAISGRGTVGDKRRCPECGAPVEIPRGARFTRCKNCGAQVGAGQAARA